ncbi:MAG TPA: hypothetical protein VNE21_05705 [Mycobacteriales bacterium]|nr:hypothetical protein [Mycobacteriales bacterium]
MPHVDATRILRSLIADVRSQADLEHRVLDELGEPLSPDEQRRIVAD